MNSVSRDHRQPGNLRSRATFSVRGEKCSQETKRKKHFTPYPQPAQEKAESISGTTFLWDKHKNVAQMNPA